MKLINPATLLHRLVRLINPETLPHKSKHTFDCRKLQTTTDPTFLKIQYAKIKNIIIYYQIIFNALFFESTYCSLI